MSSASPSGAGRSSPPNGAARPATPTSKPSGRISTMRPLTVVTGGGRGIGAAICQRLAADGHDIAFSYRADEQRARKSVEAVVAHGARCVAVPGDVASAADVDALFDAAASLGGV